MDDGSPRALLDRARDALSNAYTPYSDYRVGAALRTDDDTVFTGCNVENANFSNSLHAEEVALGSAVAAGHRTFTALAVTSASRDGVRPCGMCRQSLVEFCDADFPVYVDEGDGRGDGDVADGEPTTLRLGELLPHAIGPSDLGVEP